MIFFLKTIFKKYNPEGLYFKKTEKLALFLIYLTTSIIRKQGRQVGFNDLII